MLTPAPPASVAPWWRRSSAAAYHAQEQQRKLAAMTQHDACAQASSADRRVARSARKFSPILEAPRPTANPVPPAVRPRSARVQLQANGHEEQARQHITKGLRWLSMWCRKSLSPRTMPARRPPGRRIRRRRVQQRLPPRHAQGDQHEGFFVALPRHPAQRPCNRRREATAAAANNTSTPTLRAARSRSSASRRAPRSPEGQQGQQGHAGQVLKDQHGDALRPWRVVSSPWSASCRLTRPWTTWPLRRRAVQRSELADQPDQHQGQWRGHDDHLQAAGASTVLRVSQKCPSENSSPTITAAGPHPVRI